MVRARRQSIVLLAVAAAGVGALVASVPAASASTGPRALRLNPTYWIGFEGPLSGPYASFGINERNGVRLAIAKANASGNLPFQLRFTAADDQGDPSQAPAAALALVNNALVKGVIGPSFSGATLAAEPTYQTAHLATVNPSASNPTLSHQGWRVFHRLIPSDAIEGAFSADWLARRGTQRMFVVQDRSAYGLTVGNAVTREARAKGIHVTYVAQDGTTTTNYRPLANRITSAGVHAVFYAGYDAQAARLARALVHAGYRGVRISGNGIFSSVFTQDAGAAGNGYYLACGCMNKYATPAQHAFATAYRARYHRAPGLYSAQAYDATNALIRAIKAAVAGGHTSRRAVNAALRSVDFAGVSTQVKFARNGDIARSAARVNLFQVQHRRFVELGDIRRRG